MAIAHRTRSLSHSGILRSSEARCLRSSSGIITCFVTQPDDIVRHIDVDYKSDGLEVLTQVCKWLGIQEEADYFGLQHPLSNGDLVWLNLRNRLSKQLTSSPPYKLYLKVKYFVPPHKLILEETQHQFYLNAVQQLKWGLWDSQASLDLQAHLIALMAFVQFGPYNPTTTPCRYACFWSDRKQEMPREVLLKIVDYQRRLDGMSIQAAEYELLRTVYEEVSSYGVYFYEIMDMYSRRLLMGVGPEYVAVCNTDTTIINKYLYSQLKTVTSSGRVVKLTFLEDDASVRTQTFELSCRQTTDSLYRSITELHCFFRCDRVRDEVLSRTNPTFPFFSVSPGGRGYTFDVMHTSKEVQDRALRTLYHRTHDVSMSVETAPFGTAKGSSITYSAVERPTEESQGRRSRLEKMKEVQDLVKMVRLEECKCRVCLDRPMNCVFVPCGHLSCGECALRLTRCHICRNNIDIHQTCFFPWETSNEPSERPLGSFDLFVPSYGIPEQPHHTARSASNALNPLPSLPLHPPPPLHPVYLSTAAATVTLMP